MYRCYLQANLVSATQQFVSERGASPPSSILENTWPISVLFFLVRPVRAEWGYFTSEGGSSTDFSLTGKEAYMKLSTA